MGRLCIQEVSSNKNNGRAALAPIPQTPQQPAYDKAEPLFQEALRIKKGEEHVDSASCLDGPARVYWSKGAYDKAEPLYQDALRIKKSVLG